MLKEFKDFAMKGNVLDMAIGVIIGGAFGKIVSSLVSDVLMPPIGLLMGKVDFSSLFINLSGTPLAIARRSEGGGSSHHSTTGSFLQATFDFIIIAFVIFLLVKQVNRLKKRLRRLRLPGRPTNEEKLLMEIRDALKGRH